MGLIGLLMAYYGGSGGILSGLTESADHPSGTHTACSEPPTPWHQHSQLIIMKILESLRQGVPRKQGNLRLNAP